MDNTLTDVELPQSNTSQTAQTKPWGTGSVLIVSLLSLGTATILIIWRNLIRIGKTKTAELFIVAALMVMTFIAYTAVIFDKWSIYGMSLMIAAFTLPVWFNLKYLEEWKQQNTGIHPEFSWSILTWGLLGSFLSIVTLLFIDVLIAIIKQSNTFKSFVQN